MGCGKWNRDGGVCNRLGMQAGKRVLVQKVEIERQWLDFESGVWYGGGERWWVVVGRLVRCDGGCGTSCSQTQGRERVGQPET